MVGRRIPDRQVLAEALAPLVECSFPCQESRCSAPPPPPTWRSSLIKKLTVAAALVLGTPAAAAIPSPADRAELEQLARQMDDAWTAGDADANAALFSNDASARFAEDPLGEGREAIRGQFQGFFKDRPAGLRHATKIERIDQIAPDFALWDAEVRVERQDADGTWSTVSRIRNVTLAARSQQGWQIRAVRAFPVR